MKNAQWFPSLLAIAAIAICVVGLLIDRPTGAALVLLMIAAGMARNAMKEKSGPQPPDGKA